MTNLHGPQTVFRRLAIYLLIAITFQTPLALVAAKRPAVLRTGGGKNHVAESARTSTSLFETQTEWIRQLPITSNDLVFSQTTQKLYLSVPSTAGSTGNTITTVDPVTGVSESSIFVGSDPKTLALADDGHTLYVSLVGAAAVQRFDVVSHVLGVQFPFGNDNFYGTLALSDLAVAPGNPDLVAISRSYRGVSPSDAGVAVFDNGVRRPTVTPAHSGSTDFLTFSSSASTLYGGGFGGGLSTMTINASGVSITNTINFPSGGRSRVDNGLVYGQSGVVVNPNTGTTVGTFSGASANSFTTESTVSRAYFLTGGQSNPNYTLTLKVYDTTTFNLVGTLNIPGVSGFPSSLVRWGSNGLAFRTDGGQLFLIQTGLIPGGGPIPSPTPTPTPSPSPSPTPITTFVRQVSLTNNDVLFNPSNGKLYVSLPSTAEISGNSVVDVTPETGAVGTPIFVGSEPTKLALADDNNTLYAALEGAGGVRKVDLATQTAGLQFPVSTGFPLFVNDIEVMPGNPNVVALCRSDRYTSATGGIAIYDNGVRRTNVSNVSTFGVAFSTSQPSRLYNYGFGGSAGSGAFDRLTVNASGVSYQDSVPTIRGGDLRFDNGLLYQSGGDVIDPEIGKIKGSFSGIGSGSIMTTDSSLGRAFFLNIEFNGPPTLQVYDLNTFVLIGSFTFAEPLTSGPATHLVRWGTNGLAFRTQTKIYIIQSSLVSSSGSVPTPTPTPTPTPSPTPPYVHTFTRQVELPANDLVINNATQTLYASVPSSAGANGNSITSINPQTATIGSSVFIGSEPNRLALSDDGTTLHVSLDGAAAIRRFDIPSQTPGPQFTWGTPTQRPLEMLVMPGTKYTLATSDGGVAIYDDGVQRPNTSRGNAYAIGPIAFGATPSVIYGYDSGSSGFELVKLAVAPNGVSGDIIGNSLFSGFSSGRMKFSNDRLYQAARVVDPEAKTLLGSFANIGDSPVVALDQSLGRIFFLAASVNATVTLRAYDINTFRSIGSVRIEGVGGAPSSLVRWGTNGLAFSMKPSFQESTAVSRVYLVQSDLVSNVGSVPTGLQFYSAKYFANEENGVFNLKVARTGNVSGTTTVNYATSDVTATGGADYTPVSGTLTFGPGELEKFIAIPILDDNFFDGGAETFKVTLSSPSGGAQFGGLSTTEVSITDNESRPSMSMSGSATVLEGTPTNNTVTFNVSLTNPTAETVTVNYTTANGTATAGSDYVATSGTLTFPPLVTTMPITVTTLADSVDEPDETFTVALSNATNVNFLLTTGLTCTIINDDGPPKMSFSTSNYSISEGAGQATVTVFRIGRTNDPASVDFQTSDGTALQTRDYTIAAGTLQFAPGEVSKTFSVLITDDAYGESNEFLNLTLTNVVGNETSLGSPSTSRITIIDNEFSSQGFNPIDQPQMFVRQHYYDFLSRFPDPGGLDYWTGQISQCGTDVACNNAKRIDVSNAFFYELEYQQTGSYVYRLYRAAFGNTQPIANTSTDPNFPNEEKKLPAYSVFATDRARVRVGSLLAQTQLDLANAFVLRPNFLTRYPANLDGPGFVDAILANINTDIGVNLSSQRDALITLFNQGGRGAVVYRLADDDANNNPINNRAFIDAEYNRAFVLTQYFGYLRRNPDIGGFMFWLSQVNSAALRDVAKQHAMVCSFITSTEYQARFSFVISHNNSQCQ